MKKAIIAGLIAVSTMGAAEAHGYHGGYHHTGGWGWAGPALIGGIIGYEMARPPVYVQPQPQVIYQAPPVVIQQQPSAAEVRVMPQYSPAYPSPNGCYPVYTAQGQFAGNMCR